MIGNAWEDCLTESHREALHNALCLLVDDFLNDPDYDEPLFITALPPNTCFSTTVGSGANSL